MHVKEHKTKNGYWYQRSALSRFGFSLKTSFCILLILPFPLTGRKDISRDRQRRRRIRQFCSSDVANIFRSRPQFAMFSPSPAMELVSRVAFVSISSSANQILAQTHLPIATGTLIEKTRLFLFHFFLLSVTQSLHFCPFV